MLGLILFLIFNSFSRIVLVSLSLCEKQINFSINSLLQVFSFGAINDFIAASYFILPLALLNIIYPQKWKNTIISKALIYLFYFITINALCFLIVSEFTFWLEFSTRFNFIAVDYLVYTHEVVGNIRESYPIFVIFPLMFLIAGTIFYFTISYIKTDLIKETSFKKKIYIFLVLCSFSSLSFVYYNPKVTDIKSDNYLSELSKNGLYNLFSAFLHNTIDYDALYATKDAKQALKDAYEYITNTELKTKDFTRYIKAEGPKNEYNVILIVVESLSSEFLSIKYEDRNITPVLNELIKKSIYFDNFYATGTRTVKGLESITLGIPPLPGQSILRRDNNQHLFSIASVLKKEDYDIKFIYGGYGYFDNMNYFFAKNNFKTIDRNIIPEEEVNFENIWGISDEDLYNQVIKQADLSYNNQQKFFSLVMTTSNHRPYTYPDGKIDIPSKSNRQGGVKYTDYAIGEFLKNVSTKPWFDNTIFIITADHCAGSAGKVALPPDKYHIPLLIYAPKLYKPQVIDKLSSQIDLAPTILGLLNISYHSKFFGNDIFTKKHDNAFISTFQKLGYIEDDRLVILSPMRLVNSYKLLGNKIESETMNEQRIVNRAIDYYQSAYFLYQNGLQKE